MTALAELPTDATPAADDAHNRNDAERDAMLAAIVAQADYAPAVTLWRQKMTPAYRGMLTGENGWRWDNDTQTYINDRTGRRENNDDLKLLALLLAAETEHDLRMDASNAAVGATSVANWRERFAMDVKQLYVAVGLAGCGGPAYATPEIIAAIEGSIEGKTGLRFSLDRLYEFARGVQAGTAGSESQIVNRAGLYAAASGSVYENSKRSSHESAVDGRGRKLFLYERNILNDYALHCRECPALTDLSWVPINQLPTPGTRQCGPLCKCRLVYSLVGPLDL